MNTPTSNEHTHFQWTHPLDNFIQPWSACVFWLVNAWSVCGCGACENQRRLYSLEILRGQHLLSYFLTYIFFKNTNNEILVFNFWPLIFLNRELWMNIRWYRYYRRPATPCSSGRSLCFRHWMLWFHLWHGNLVRCWVVQWMRQMAENIIYIF